MLDLKLLETYREVATRGSFSDAAETLGFTQPAVSQHIARLEKQVGVRLLDRDSRGVTPTRAGLTLLRHAESLLDAARRAEVEVREQAGLHVPEVRIGAFASAAAGLVPMALRELRAARPDVRPKLTVLDDEPAMDALAVGRIDVALLISFALWPLVVRDGLETELVLEDPMHVALPPGHPLARYPAVPLEALRDEPWMLTAIGGTCQDSNVVRRACADAGFDPEVQIESEDYPALLGLTASGMGVTLIPSLAAMQVPPDVVIRPLAGEAPARQILAARRAGEAEPQVTAAIDALRIAGRRLALGVAPAPAAAAVA